MKPRRFSKSFRRVYDELTPNEQCNLKHHYRGAIREVVGLLDLWAANDPERFVELYGGVDAIVSFCHRYQSKEKFGKRWIEYALAELRAHYIISKQLKRIRDGAEVVGFIVTPHDCLAVRDSPTKCVFKGQLKAAGRWQRDPVLDEKGEWTGKLGPVFWAGYSNSAVQSAANSAVESAVNSAVDDLALTVTPSNDCAARRGTTVLAVKSVEPCKPRNPVIETGQVENGKGNTNTNRKSDGESNGVVVFDTTDQRQIETIGDHFADLPDNYTDAIIELSTGLISDGDISAVANGQRFYSWPDLAACCRAVVRQRAGIPYLGRKTNGDLMAGAMVLFTERYKLNVPRNWYAVAKTLRESPPEKHYLDDYSAHDAEVDKLVADLKAEAASKKS